MGSVTAQQSTEDGNRESGYCAVTTSSLIPPIKSLDSNHDQFHYGHMPKRKRTSPCPQPIHEVTPVPEISNQPTASYSPLPEPTEYQHSTPSLATSSLRSSFINSIPDKNHTQHVIENPPADNNIVSTIPLPNDDKSPPPPSDTTAITAANDKQPKDDTPSSPTNSADNGKTQSDSAGTMSSNPQKRPLSHACLLCRRKKIRCDSKSPSCDNCLRRGIKCIYPELKRRGRPPRVYTFADFAPPGQALPPEVQQAMAAAGVELSNPNSAAVAGQSVMHSPYDPNSPTHAGISTPKGLISSLSPQPAGAATITTTTAGAGAGAASSPLSPPSIKLLEQSSFLSTWRMQ